MAPASRVHPLVPALLAVVVVGVLVLLVASSSGDGGTGAATATTSSTASTATGPTTTASTVPEPFPVEELVAAGPAVEVPAAYRITYEVVENGLPRVEEWTVRRPYESLVLSRRGDVLLSGTSTSRSKLQTYLSDDAGWLPIQPELHRAAFDQHPAAAVAAMEALGLVEVRGEEEHLGRTCTVYRTGQPPSAGEPTPPTDAEHSELCVDRAGLVLHERWTIGGDVVAERTATALELEPRIDPASFDPGERVDDDVLSAAFSTIAVRADEETLARLRTEVPLPPGYVDDGAVFRAGHAPTTAAGAATPGSAEIVRFLSAGPALLEVAEVFVAGDAELRSGAAVPVEVDGWDEVWFEPGFRSSSLRARTGRSSYMELRHHDVAFLFDVLASVRRTDG